jgi:hypothetical protein
VLYGGFSKEKLKKDKEKGVVHSDMFVLSHEVKKTGLTEWSWSKVKQTGLKPSERISFSMVTLHDDSAILFGGVFDNQNTDEDEEADSLFFNDLYKLDLASFKWTCLTLRGKKEIKRKTITTTTTKSDPNKTVGDTLDANKVESESDEEEEEEEEIDLEKLKIDHEDSVFKPKQEDSAFSLTLETKSDQQQQQQDTVVVVAKTQNAANVLVPHQRRSSYIQFHKGLIYLYGGKYENKDDKEFCFNDMYVLNTKKLDEWKCLYEDKELDVSELSQTKDTDSWEEDDDDSDSDSDDMEIDAPPIEPNESQETYFERNSDFWLKEAETEFPGTGKAIVKKMASELCSMFWKNFQKNQTASA